MGKINVLTQEVANMISAGEVVERPSSVVKELVENSIDALAKSITVEIKNGGMSYIRVTDNGGGIEKDDLKTAFLPHATSKIKNGADLAKIMTLGFRGEALASIAAVSCTEVFTKTKDSNFGSMLTIKGGEVIAEDETGCANGTTVIVRDLFYNTPARMKFLKKDSAETAYITDVMNKFILGNPNIAIKYLSPSKNITAPGDGKLINSIFAVYGRDYINNVIEVDYADENARVTGYIGNSQISRNTRAYQTFFINGRNFVSKIVSAALSEGYKNTVMVGKFPFAVLNIEVNPAFVDVNVHPTKMEVRFSDDKKIFETVYWAVKNALEKKRIVPEIKMYEKRAEKKKFDVPENIKKSSQMDINLLRDAFVKNKESYQADIVKNKGNYEKEALDAVHFAENSKNISDDKKGFDEKKLTIDDLREKTGASALSDSGGYFADDEFVKTAKSIETFESQKSKSFENEGKISENIENLSKNTENIENSEKPNAESTPPLKAGVDFKVIGQIFSTYIILEMGAEMHIIDQHAAHERLYFEEFLEDYKNKSILSQIMLIPATVSLTPPLFETAVENKEFFASLGFELDDFGNNVVVIRKIPAALEGCNVSELIIEIAEILQKKSNVDLTDLSEISLHTMACKRAIKGNTPLSFKEMEDLAQKVYTLGSINTCPHGRPIEIKMSKKDLEKEFKRIV
ncbi:MAG: DNA mismatch repair endonuclease MutL [Clostridia bacterium]|nr:DNA mismatch repair endonuclease MutL [Clostridia bacterium]